MDKEGNLGLKYGGPAPDAKVMPHNDGADEKNLDQSLKKPKKSHTPGESAYANIWKEQKTDEMRDFLKMQYKQMKECEKNEDIPDGNPSNIRLYQLKRDLILDPAPMDLMSSYMELVI